MIAKKEFRAKFYEALRLLIEAHGGVLIGRGDLIRMIRTEAIIEEFYTATNHPERAKEKSEKLEIAK